MLIGTSREEICMTINHSDENVTYKETTLDKNNFVALRIVDDKATERTLDPSAVDYDSKSSEKLTDSEIDLKVHDCHNLSSKEKLIFADLLRKYRSIFRKKPSLFTTYTHKLNLKDDQPFYVKPYPIPMNFKNKVRAEVEKMLKLNIVRHSTSPYINPVAVVPKSDNSVRMCPDAQRLNAKLYKDHESPPSIESIFQKCQNIQFMSTMNRTKYTVFLRPVD